MSNSPLATYTLLSPNCNKPRNHVLDMFVPHTMAGNMTARNCATMFANPAIRVSSNYAIGSDGEIALIVDEANRSWCTSSALIDNRAITVEVASLTAAEPFKCSNEALDSLIKLGACVCRRNPALSSGLLWRADKSLIGQVDLQNMAAHRWTANKSCPGDYLYGMFGEIAAEVNRRLGAPVAAASTRPAAPDKPVAITVGNSVMITGDQFSTGQVVPLWARNVPHVVSRIHGGKALLGNPDGINSWVAIKNLKRV